MKALRLVLVETEGDVNLGMIARLCENFEVDELVLVNPKADLDEARRYAARAAWRLDEALIVGSLEEALAGSSLSVCTSSHHSTGKAERIPVDVRDAAQRMVAEDGLVALVMGRESVGLTLEELAKCDMMATIKASPRYPSLNLANATAIFLYEIYRARHGGVERRPPPAETRRLLEAYAKAMAGITFTDPARVLEVAIAIRRLASVAEEQEARLLLYLLSRVCTRLQGCQDEVRRHMQPGP